MLSAIWTGALTASDIFLLCAAIVAGLAAALDVAGEAPQSALIPAAVALLALGLLAL